MKESLDAIKKPSKPPKVTMSSDGLEAFLTIPLPAADDEFPQYTVDELVEILNQQKVVYGIDEQALQAISDMPEFGTKTLVATGLAAQQGTQGEFEYFFTQDFSRKPKIREDGSADFFAIKTVELVHEGQLLVTYHPAVQGVQGKTVSGRVIEPKPMRDMPPLGGRGFTRSDDNLHYYAAIDGKIVVQNNRLLISPVYEIAENADMTTGNIDFNGDVVIHGGANGGVKIKARGSVTIEGLVEICDIEAGQDIFLLSGVKGKNQTRIRAKGNITAEFVEYVYMEAKGNIQADVIFKSKVECYGSILLVGNRAELIGGNITAIQGINAGKIGNDFGTITCVGVGADVAHLRRIRELEEKIGAMTKNIEKIKQGVAAFDRASEQKGVTNYREDPRRMELLRVKIRDEAVVSEHRLVLDELRKAADQGKDATVQVRDRVYVGARVSIGNEYVNVSDEQYQVEFIKTGGTIRMERMDPEELSVEF